MFEYTQVREQRCIKSGTIRTRTGTSIKLFPLSPNSRSCNSPANLLKV
ncbi:hypothetical protein [Pontibacter flavimaris]|nr:hypothetical protein [Pontibacter flavimaris]